MPKEPISTPVDVFGSTLTLLYEKACREFGMTLEEIKRSTITIEYGLVGVVLNPEKEEDKK